MKHITNSLLTVIFLSIFHLTVWANTPPILKASTTKSIEQYGITWTFADPVEYGQFVNGDYWVVDSGDGVKVTSISPGYTTHPITGRAMNGSMVNPVSMQGYDGYSGYGSDYVTATNVGIGISEASPLVLTGNSSLVSTISNLAPGTTGKITHVSYVKTAAILTSLTSSPPAGSFRPGMCGRIKPLYNEAKLNKSLLKKLPVPSGQKISATTLTTYARYLQMPFLDHITGWTGRFLHPSDSGLNNYYFPQIFADAALMLHLDFTDEEKKALLINYVQLGIDFYSFINSGARGWTPEGGFGSGRKWPIIFAGLMLGDDSMKNVGQVSGDYLYSDGHGPGNYPANYKSFTEDGQTFYVSQSDVDITNGIKWDPDKRSAPNYPYSEAMLGMPEWGIRYATDQNKSDSSWNAMYRTIGTAGPAWAGFSLAARLMEAKGLWNHNAFFDYVDRYMAISTGKPDPFGFSVYGDKVSGKPQGFVGAMWEKYRTRY